MAADETAKDEVLRVAIDEQRRVYDELTVAFHQVSVKILTLIAAGFTLLTFLYSGGDLFIPDDIDGRIFYFSGLVLTFGALGNLLHATRPNGQKEVPTEQVQLSKLTKRETIEFLDYVNNRYISCFKTNADAYHAKLKVLSQSFYPLVIGATILVILKVFGD